MNRSHALQIVKRLGLRQLSVTTKTLPYTWQFRYISAVTGAPSPRPLDHKRQPHKNNRPTHINKAMQPTVGRSDALLRFMTTPSVQSTLAAANGG